MKPSVVPVSNKATGAANTAVVCCLLVFEENAEFQEEVVKTAMEFFSMQVCGLAEFHPLTSGLQIFSRVNKPMLGWGMARVVAHLPASRKP
jgi:hypothetical protein